MSMDERNDAQSDGDWHEQQTEYALALVDPSIGVPDFVANTKGQPSQKRFNVYRNNVMVGLSEAINAAYPVTAQLVGEEFATAMARVYVGDHLPCSPVLAQYGAGYGDFIEQFEPAKSLPYLPDLARLEWAWLTAYHGADHVPLAVDALADIGEDELGKLTVEFCPCVQFLCSDYPIVSIWSAHQGKGREAGLENIGEKSECALVNRPLWDVSVHTLTPGLYAFFTSLHEGAPLGVSIDKGNCFGGFNAADAISALFATGSVAELTSEDVG